MAGYVEGKDKNQILTELVDVAMPGSRLHEQHKMAIIVHCTEDLEKSLTSLEKSMNNNAAASSKLAAKVLWLNVILATATAVGTIAGVAQLFIQK